MLKTFLFATDTCHKPKSSKELVCHNRRYEDLQMTKRNGLQNFRAFLHIDLTMHLRFLFGLTVSVFLLQKIYGAPVDMRTK